jgi:hypothetical protein
MRSCTQWLDAFKKAYEGDQKQRAILARYSRHIAAKVEKEHWKRLVRAEVVCLCPFPALGHFADGTTQTWQERLRSRPILTGALLKASLYNPPLPRMKPQPPAISKIIGTRMRTRERRFARVDKLAEDIRDLQREAEFEEAALDLAGAPAFEPVYCGAAAREWRTSLFSFQFTRFYADRATQSVPCMMR